MNVNGKPSRTIWPHPTHHEIIQIIDQRHLPHEFIIEDLQTVADFAAAISEMHVRGAGLIGATAGFGMYCAALSAPDNNFDSSFVQAGRILRETRPTAKNLVWAIERQINAVKEESDPSAKRKICFKTACEIADEDANFCRRIGEHGLNIIRKISERKNGEPVNILTHCNAGWLAFVDYGSATAPVYAAHHNNIKVHVWVDETRPWLQGAKLTCWELAQEGVEHTLIADNTGGHLMQHGLVDMVITGTDRTTFTGDVANKIGTYLKALAARDCHIPFYVALPSSTFDWQIKNGLSEIPIEQRSGHEIKYITGLTSEKNQQTVRICPEKTMAANYAFDVTPARLITGLITERGVVKADSEAILDLYPEHRGS